jgi:hypothetical protein
MTVAELIKELEKMPQDYIVKFGGFNQDIRFVEINEYKERVELYLY